MAGLTDYTFKDTGIPVKIRRISPMIAADVAAAFPEPQPPEQEVDYGEPKGKVLEKNFSDPGYLQALAQHRQKIFVALQRVMILRSVVPVEEDWKAQVDEYREFMLQATGVPIDEPNDLVLYVLRICVGSEDDLNEYLTTVMSRSQPTQEAIEAAKDSFRG